MDGLVTAATALGVHLSKGQKCSFQRYLLGLTKWSERVNLTSPRVLADATRVHFLDSLTLVPVLRELGREVTSLVDVGAGAGFPGVPVKLALPHVRLALVEANGKKANFLRWLVEALTLGATTVLADRAENLAHREVHREAYDVATARAVGTLPTVLELALPFCQVGGIAVLPRAGDVAAQVASAARAAGMLGGRIRAPIPVTAQGLRADAAIVVVDKVEPTPARYPRRSGMPATRPLL